MTPRQFTRAKRLERRGLIDPVHEWTDDDDPKNNRYRNKNCWKLSGDAHTLLEKSWADDLGQSWTHQQGIALARAYYHLETGKHPSLGVTLEETTTTADLVFSRPPYNDDLPGSNPETLDIAVEVMDVLAVQADVTDDGDVERLIEEAVDAFGTVDILVNNVGTTGSFERLEDVPREEWEFVVETTLLSTMAVTKAALPHLREGGGARIVNVASDAGLMPHGKMPQYNAAKAGMINLTTNLSRAYANDGFRVNAVAPGTTKTPLVEEMMDEMAAERGITPEAAERAFLSEEKPIIDVERFAEPEEVASVVAFLASDAASYVTGSTYRIDGGAIPSINV